MNAGVVIAAALVTTLALVVSPARAQTSPGLCTIADESTSTPGSQGWHSWH